MPATETQFVLRGCCSRKGLRQEIRGRMWWSLERQIGLFLGRLCLQLIDELCFLFFSCRFFLSLCILSGLTMSDLQQVFKGPQSILRNEQSHRTLITTKRKGGKKVILAGRWIAECLLLTYLNVLMKMRCNKFLVIKNASFSSAIQILACRQTAQSAVKLITRKQMLDENAENMADPEMAIL